MTTTVRELMRPILPGQPDGVTYDAMHNDVNGPDWSNRVLERWDSGNFTAQGQRLQAATADPAQGCINFTTGRLAPGFQPVGSILELEFMFSGAKLDIVFADPGDTYDTQVYVGEGAGPQLRRLKDKPLVSTVRGGANNLVMRRVRFATSRERRIRIVLPLCLFVGIAREANDVIAKAPERHLAVVNGDSYVEPLSARNAGSGETYHTYGVCDAIFEATGFALARVGQGGTGYFNPATGQYNADQAAYGPYYSSVFFSPHRRYSMQDFLVPAAKALLLIVNGTINDGELSGQGSGVASASNMQARVTEALDWVQGLDPKVRVVQVSPEPYNNQMTNPSGPHMVNRQGQKAAFASHPSAGGYVDACDPAAPFFSGTGYEGNPSASSQAKFTGADQIHGNAIGYGHYGQRIAAALADVVVPDDRARRVA